MGILSEIDMMNRDAEDDAFEVSSDSETVDSFSEEFEPVETPKQEPQAEDAEPEEKFVPKTYNGKATKAGKKEKPKKAAPKPAPKPVDEEQLTFGDFGTEEAAG